jgi:uncharacterized protein (TIGR03435 family)
MLALLGAGTHATGVQSQPNSANLPKFEVASVRPNNSTGVPRPLRVEPGGRVVATNVPIASVIHRAFQIERHQLAGGPSWMATDRFDIAAKAEDTITAAPPGKPAGPLELMLQSLLADRFSLTAHWEQQDLPLWALVKARADGRLGPMLRRVDIDCHGDSVEAERTVLQPPQKGRSCSFITYPWVIRADGTSIPRFIERFLQSRFELEQRPILDETGLVGTYDIQLTWTTSLPQNVRTPPPGTGVPIPEMDPNGPSLFTALQEQLGLKLESRRGPVRVLVIDRLERPSPN